MIRLCLLSTLLDMNKKIFRVCSIKPSSVIYFYAYLQMVGVSTRLPPILRLVEIKTLAEQLNFKISTLLMHGGKLIEAIIWFRRHIDAYRRLVGAPDANFLHWEWLSRQCLVFAELLESSSAAIPNISSATSGTADKLTEWEFYPAYYYQVSGCPFFTFCFYATCLKICLKIYMRIIWFNMRCLNALNVRTLNRGVNITFFSILIRRKGKLRSLLQADALLLSEHQQVFATFIQISKFLCVRVGGWLSFLFFWGGGGFLRLGMIL